MTTYLSQTAKAVAMACIAFSAVTAQAQFFDDREARKSILELRQRVEADRQAATVNQTRLLEEVRRSSEENASLRGQVLDLQSQLEAIRTDIGRLRQQNDAVNRELAESQKRAKDLLQPFEERLRKLEPFKVTVDGKEFLTEAGDKREYEAGLALFRSGDFAGAQNIFQSLVRRNPASGFVPSSLFWLGNAQYATRDYTGAVSTLRSLIGQAPDHPRVPDALLALANSQIELNDNAGARRSLEDIVRSYPRSEAAGPARERLARLK